METCNFASPLPRFTSQFASCARARSSSISSMRSRGRNLHNTTTPRTRRTLTPLPPPMQRIARLRHPSIHTRSIPGPHDFPHPRSSPPTSFPSPLRPPRLFCPQSRFSQSTHLVPGRHLQLARANAPVITSRYPLHRSRIPLPPPASTAAPSSHDCPQDRTPIRRSLPLFTPRTRRLRVPSPFVDAARAREN
ncbi:hypothetical protein B0H13DRAFT_884956 [Mycena leptocephala]|nr:hypothetical protein B0H13DRAFT_884956 [Mycena leptocephala]